MKIVEADPTESPNRLRETGPEQGVHGERRVGGTRRRQAAVDQRHVVDLDPRDIVRPISRGQKPPIRRPRRTPARQRQMRMKRALLQPDSQPRDARRDLALHARSLRGRRRSAPATAHAGRRAGGNSPSPPKTIGKRLRLEPVARSPRPPTGARPSSSSPRKASVRCMCSGRIHFSADRSPRSAACNRVCTAAMARRAASSRSMAMNRRIAANQKRRSFQLARRSDISKSYRSKLEARTVAGTALVIRQHQPQHVQRRLRRLELDLLAAADELKRAHARARRRRRPRSRRCRPASRPFRRPVRRCR